MIQKICEVLPRVAGGLHLAALRHALRGQWKVFFRICSRTGRETSRIKNYNLESIPEQALADILGRRAARIQLSVMPYEEGMLPSHEAMALLSILVVERPAAVLEIGTFMGHTTRAMAENLPGSIIHTVDLPQDFALEATEDSLPAKDDFHLIRRRVVGREFVGTPLAAQIVQHYGDTAVWDFNQAGRPGAFFIDGSHTYDHCKSDSEKCLQIAAPGAVFFWHDCDAPHDGVTRFIAEWRRLGRAICRITGTSLAYWRMS